MRETVLEILTSIRPDVSFEDTEGLITNGILESFDLVSIISELADEFNVTITTKELVPENFDSVNAIVAMIERLG